jgi:molybdate transport system substrate-binding protein
MAGFLKFGMAMVVLGGLAGVVASEDPARADTLTEALTVGAAHSLKGPFQEIIPMFEKEYGVSVQVVYGPSQTLRRQIEQGAPIDVFLPEAVEEVETLQKKGLTLNGGPRIFAQSSLVLVMATTSAVTSVSFDDGLPDRATRVALVDPKTSALGAITAKALTSLHPGYTSRSRVLRAEHSDDVVNLVRGGKADVGIVYRVDAINNGHVRIIDETPAGTATSVQFGEAVVWTCRDASRDIAERFFDFMLSPRIQKLLVKYGFDPVPLTTASRTMEQKP